MSTPTTTRSSLLSHSAYALLGAGDLVLDQARQLSGKRDELPEQVLAQLNDAVDNLRKAVDSAVDELNDQAVRRREEATGSLDDLADRGRALFDRLSREGDVRAASADVDQARQGLLGVVTAIRRGAGNVVGRAKAAVTLSSGAASSVADASTTVAREVTGTRHAARLEDHTKAELYELATARDIDGRSSMSKAQLVTALRTRTDS